jgi:DNA-binding GntR family transcriptional regulator
MRQEPGTARRKTKRGVHRVVYEHFADLIDSGQMLPGDRVPTSKAMAERWNISHATAAKVLQNLRDQGYITTTTRGSFVRGGSASRLLFRLCDVLNEMEAAGQAPRVKVSKHGAFVIARDGGVHWNETRQQWEPMAP